MSLYDRIEEEIKDEGFFAIIGGKRLGGKSTLAGTAPGKTLFLYAKELETGYKAAQKLAIKCGNELVPIAFKSTEDLTELVIEASTSDFDNIYIDGITAVAEMKLPVLDKEKKPKDTVWDVFGKLGDSCVKCLLLCKSIAADTSKNVFITMALKTDKDGYIVPDIKGNMTLGAIQKVCPTVLAVRTRFTEGGELKRVLLSKSDEDYPARVDGLLDEENPGEFEADLSQLINFINKEKV
jgi:hypothetical protein